ncbi:MAG: hypothetical protein P4M09_23325 [Devosia sp.]|nr:hypothetical protein [Devosia sp.]
MARLRALRAQFTAHRLAQVAILAELLAAVRTLGEVYRLRAEHGAAFTLDAAMVWITAALIVLGFLAASSLLYFAGRERLAGVAALVMIVVLIVYKAMAIGLS